MTAVALIAAAELALIAFMVWERSHSQARLLDTVAHLCQRLQAPGAAVLAYSEQDRQPPPEDYAPPAIEPDDDEAYWLSREKLAEHAMRAEIDGSNG